MAELRGMLSTAILKVVGQQIASVIGGQIKLQKDITMNLEKIKMALESVEAVLEDAERRSIKEEPTLLWLQQLKDMMYDISHMIDLLEFDKEAKFSLKRYLAIMIPCLAVGPKIPIADLVNSERLYLQEIIYGRNQLNFSSCSNTNELEAIDVWEISSIMEKQVIVGRTEERQKILSSLSESITKEMIILAIYGIGGLGKTTMAKMVYNSSQFQDYSHVWVYVSQTFDLKKIGNSIISQLSVNESQQTEIQMIQFSLSKMLAGKRILIVLDGLWEDKLSNLDRLKDMLKVGKRSKVVVLVTTRSEGIAENISSIQPHKLETLTDDMCLSIIKQKSAFESRGDKKHLEQIGREIAMKCGGAALAAQSLGHLLHSATSTQWEWVRNSDFWNVCTSEATPLIHVLESLKLSYSILPPHLKLCFAYCAIFPKGHKIVKDELIYQWISLGFIEPTNAFSFWQLGERYIRQLVGLSFLQDSMSPSNAEVYHEDFTHLTMQDLVHDLARAVMVDDIIVSGKDINIWGKSLKSAKIRALLFFDSGEVELDGVDFSCAKSLRVLDLSECFIRKLPDSIGLLKQLRYLKAPKIQYLTIPNSITELSKLSYLTLRGSSAILALPESIGEIGSLMYLDLSGCSGIEELPESVGKLNKLVHLDLSGCSGIAELPQSFGRLTKLVHLDLSGCSRIEELPESFGRLNKLVHLDCSNCSRLSDLSKILESLRELQYLNFSSKLSYLEKLPEAMGSFVNLRYLNLSGCHYLEELPESFGTLERLVHLDLSNCPKVNGIPKVLGGLTNLQYLNLSRTCHGVMTRLRGLPEVIGNLTNLRYLNLSRCMSSIFENYSDSSSKFQIDSFMYRVSTLSNLEHLELSRNDSISTVPQSLSNLKTEYCRNLKIHTKSMAIPCFAAHAIDRKSSSNIVLLQHMDLDELHITNLENVKSSEEAENIKLMEKKRLEDLKLEWGRQAERFVDDKVLLEKLAPPSTLKKLEISGYNGVSFPAWLMGQLPNLELLVLRGMESLEEWNTSYSSDEEYMIQELEIYDCPKLKMEQLPRAVKLKISNSDNLLSSWGECTISHNGASSSYSPVTTIVQVEYCKVSLRKWRLLHHLIGLTGLSVSHCDDLTCSPEIIQCLSSLKILAVAAKYREELPEWLGELTSLQQLNIVRYSGATELHDNMRQLTNLQSLNMYGCSSMTSLPHWLGELTSLKTLYIFGCDGIRSLPEGIVQLCNLQELEIYNSPRLVHWVESEENEIKLTHSQERVCVLPTSLKKLVISECHGILSLPEGIQHLSDLQQLQIYLCPLLKQWCESEENLTKLTHIEEKDIL